MFWTIVGALLFVMFGLPLILGIAATIIGVIIELCNRGEK